MIYENNEVQEKHGWKYKELKFDLDNREQEKNELTSERKSYEINKLRWIYESYRWANKSI